MQEADPGPAAKSGSSTLAIIAIVVSACSAIFTFGGLAWQLALYRLQGARLKVQLLFRFRTDTGMTVTIAEQRKTPSRDRMLRFKETGHLGIEYGFIRVTNIGRTAVSVESIGFDLGRSGRGRHIVTTLPFRDADTDPSDPIDLNTPHRLEPGANISVGLHLWPALSQGRGTKRDFTVRGTATAVGRRPTRSRRRYAWRLPHGAVSRFPEYLPPRETFVYRSLWVRSSKQEVKTEGDSFAIPSVPMFAFHEIVEVLDKGGSHKEVAACLDEINEGGIHGMVAYDIHKAYHSAPTEIPKSRTRLRRALWGADS